MRGVTLDAGYVIRLERISTRTPHAGSDTTARLNLEIQLISTRTPHAGSDHALHGLRLLGFHFNPHSPCGE